MEAIVLLIIGALTMKIVFSVGGGSTKEPPKPPANYEPSKTHTNFTNGYDPIRQVHWTKRDKIEIGEF